MRSGRFIAIVIVFSVRTTAYSAEVTDAPVNLECGAAAELELADADIGTDRAAGEGQGESDPGDRSYQPLPVEDEQEPEGYSEAQPSREAYTSEDRAMAGGEGEGVVNLPYAQGKSFETLDEYLAHHERLGAVDLPWWRRIGPDLYEHVVRMPGADRETATRAELMQRFGFDR